MLSNSIRKLIDHFPGLNDKETSGDASGRWRKSFWLVSALPPLILYGFEALRVTLYHTAQSPNMGTTKQLGLTLLVFGVWIFVPRAAWRVISFAMNRNIKTENILVGLTGLGLLLAIAHLFLLTLLRLSLFATQAWLWRPIHILHNYGEVWLSFGAIWLTGYVILSLTIWTFLRREPVERAAAPPRYEVREKGETLLIALDEIFWIKAAGNYVELHTVRGVKMLRKTLASIEIELANAGFLKAHRSALINVRHVTSIKNEGSGFMVVLANEHQAPLSRRRVAAVKAILGGGALTSRQG